jgi:hypothetical protein
MTPAERIEKAFDDANLVIADYLQPGERDAEEAMNLLIGALDNREVHEALEKLLQADDVGRRFAQY